MGNSLTLSSYGVKRTCTDFVGVLIEYSEGLKIILCEEYNNYLRTDFEKKFFKLIEIFVVNNIGVKGFTIVNIPFYKYKRRELENFVNDIIGEKEIAENCKLKSG